MIRYLPGHSDRWPHYIISVDHRAENDREGLRLYGAEHLHWGEKKASVEWSLLQRRYRFGLGFELKIGARGSENDQRLTLYLGPIGNLYLSHGKGFLPKAWVLSGYDSRVFGFKIGTGSARFDMGAKRHSWSSSDPWWMRGHVDYKRTLLGKSKSERTTVDSGACIVPMREGGYPATWDRERFTSRYVGRLGRFRDWVLGPRSHDSINVTIPGGIPVEGKGENSWDCGMDGVFSSSGPAKNVDEAVHDVAASVARQRHKYGGPWPDEPRSVASYDDDGGDQGVSDTSEAGV